MRKTMAICRREWGSYFASPIAYVVLAVFVVLSGFFFYAMTSEFLRYCLRTDSSYVKGLATTPNVNEMLIRPLLASMGFMSMLLLPMLSMRLMAEENRSGTIRLLLASPVTSGQIVMGKYLASLLLYVCMLATSFVYQALYFWRSSPDWQPVVVGYLGLALLGAAFLALGIFVSACTRNQIVAGILTFGFLLLFWLLIWAGENSGPTWKTLFDYVSIYSHHEDMTKGILDTSDLVYFGSVIFLGLFLARNKVESYRWK